MNCCHAQTGRKPRQGWWRGASGCVGSGALLVLLPKCPLCIAAFLALWTGAGVAVSVATHLRPALEILFVASAALLLVRCVLVRPSRRHLDLRHVLAVCWTGRRLRYRGQAHEEIAQLAQVPARDLGEGSRPRIAIPSRTPCRGSRQVGCA